MLDIPEMTQQISIVDLMKNGTLILVNGELHMTNNIANGISNSIVSFGEGANNTVINNNGISEDILLKLFKEIDSSELNSDDREELKELIEAAQAAFEGDKPKQSVVRRMLEGTKAIMDNVSNSPALIDAYTKWVQFIQNPPTL